MIKLFSLRLAETFRERLLFFRCLKTASFEAVNRQQTTDLFMRSGLSSRKKRKITPTRINLRSCLPCGRPLTRNDPAQLRPDPHGKHPPLLLDPLVTERSRRLCPGKATHYTPITEIGKCFEREPQFSACQRDSATALGCARKVGGAFAAATPRRPNRRGFVAIMARGALGRQRFRSFSRAAADAALAVTAG